MLDVFRVMSEIGNIEIFSFGGPIVEYTYMVAYFERVPVRILSVFSASQSKRWTQPKVRLLGTMCIFTTLKTTADREQSGF